MDPVTSKISQERQGALLPAFVTRAECRAWLDARQEGEPQALLVEIERQLGRLNRHPLSAAERFAILETLRPRLTDALAGNRTRFADRPLPLRPAEQAALDASLAAWNALAKGYLRCVDGADGDMGSAARPLAAAAQRALATLAELQLDCYRSNHAMPAGHWRAVHRAYAAAEAAGQARTAVADPARHGDAGITPFAAWSECQLLQLASLHELPARQVDWVARWARRWCGKLETHDDAAARTTPLLCADLASDQPASYRAKPVADTTGRLLDSSALRRSLKKRLQALEAGKAPAAIGLGDDCVMPLARELLIQVYARWCKGGAARRHERRAAAGACLVVGGLEAAHFHISGGMEATEPDAPAMTDRDIRRQREELAVFGRILAAPPQGSQAGETKPLHPSPEVWRMLDQSAAGVRLLRSGSRSGQRIIAKQLVALRTPDMKMLHLGAVRRATVDDDGDLHVGVRIFAGEPAPILVRATGINAARSKPVAAFLLPDIAALGEASTLILPSGWFRRERVLEVLPGRAMQIRLTGLVERGSDYERVSYEMLPPAA